MQPTPFSISSPTVSPHVSDVMDLCSGLIMNVSVSSKLLLRTQNPTEGDKINMVVSTIHHPMYLISGLIIEVGGVELVQVPLHSSYTGNP